MNRISVSYGHHFAVFFIDSSISKIKFLQLRKEGGKTSAHFSFHGGSSIKGQMPDPCEGQASFGIGGSMASSPYKGCFIKWLVLLYHYYST
jgi:hypothetical protein